MALLKISNLRGMSLFVASLNSGSNGNCYYLGNGEDAILIDAGISCREIERRLKRLNLSIKKIKAVFITHEHSDHIYGLPTLTKKHRIPVYITKPTFQQSRLWLDSGLVREFSSRAPVAVGGLTITPFPVFHDAVDPHNFLVTNESVRVGVFTDLGNINEDIIHHFRQCHAAFLESNYDEELLETGKYPIHLKNRIRGGFGHLSNVQAARLFTHHRPDFMSHLFLSHLSRNNNSPHIVENLFTRIKSPTRCMVATRYRETRLYHIRNLAPHLIDQMKKRGEQNVQLDLF